MKMWRWDGASFVSAELNGSRVELAGRRGKEKLWTFLCPAVKQWSLFSPKACWVSCELTQNRKVAHVWSLNTAVTKDCSLLESLHRDFFMFTMATAFQGWERLHLLEVVIIKWLFLELSVSNLLLCSLDALHCCQTEIPFMCRFAAQQDWEEYDLSNKTNFSALNVIL